MSQPKSLLLYCQHSVGIGHLVRSFALAESLGHQFDVTLVSGGAFPPKFSVPSNIRFIQLIPIAQNEAGNLELVESGLALHEVMTIRKKRVMEVYKKHLPDILLTEFFPFGKIQFMGELLPILKLIKKSEKPVMVVSSLRDILELKSTAERVQQRFSISVTKQNYHAILVHGDADFVRLEETFPEIKQITLPIHYTGFVTKHVPSEGINHQKFNKVVLSLGGGKVGPVFVDRVVGAYKNYGFGEGITLKVIAGPNYPADKWEEAQRLFSEVEGLELVHSVPSLLNEWRQARLSVSMAGYNTSMELISHKIPALLLPYENATNTEQTLRSQKLQAAGLARTIDFNKASEKDIAKAIKDSLDFIPSNKIMDMNGADNSSALLTRLVDEHYDKLKTAVK